LLLRQTTTKGGFGGQHSRMNVATQYKDSIAPRQAMFWYMVIIGA
jgi:hypothetical protein